MTDESTVQVPDDLEPIDEPTVAAEDIDPLTGLTGAQLAGLAKLRVPFPEGELLYLSRVICEECRKAKANRQACSNTGHTMMRPCIKCKQTITSAHIDIPYVGHAALTHRLLQVDPNWSWEPMGRHPSGVPFMQDGGMWINLTVCGVTRSGFGDGGDRGRKGKTEGDFTKECIGDALRNAGMRFGMALDLWHKGGAFDLEDARGEAEPESRPDPASERNAARQQAVGEPQQPPAFSEAQVHRAQEIFAMAKVEESPDEIRVLYRMANAEELLPCPIQVGAVAAIPLGDALREVADHRKEIIANMALLAATEAAAVTGEAPPIDVFG